jgi:hypothetical protein
LATTNGRTDEGPNPRRLALGLISHLRLFAARHRARTWKDLSKGDAENWKYYILIALNDPDMEIFFNLQGVNVGVGLLRAASIGATPTDWELLTIYQNPEWWPRIRWFDGAIVISNPFDSAE